jgi:integrase
MPKIDARVKLTKRTVDALDGGDVDRIVWDAELPGFGVRVRNARKMFVFQYGARGRTRRMTLGEYGTLTCEGARERARALRQRVQEGGDPATERDDARRGERLDAFFERYVKHHAELHNKPRSVREFRRLAEKILLPKLGTRKVDAITHTDAQRLHHDLHATPYQANRVLELLSRLMSIAELWGFRPRGSNPCKGIAAYKEHKRQRFLSARELAELGTVLADVERERVEWPVVVPAIRLLIFTGARVSEILTLKWEWVDLERSCLNLPDSKTGAKTIHLNAPALNVLAEIERDPDNSHVIRGRLPGKCLVNLSHPWARIRRRAGIPDVRIHDLRHSFAAVAAGAGSSLPIIGALLGHMQPQTTARYAHLAADPLKAVNEAVGARIAAAMTPKRKGGPGNVVELTQAR